MKEEAQQISMHDNVSIKMPTESIDSGDLTEQRESTDEKHISEKSTKNFNNYLETSAIQKGIIRHEDDPFWTERKGTFGQKFSSPSKYDNVESKLFTPTDATAKAQRKKFIANGTAAFGSCLPAEEQPDPLSVTGNDDRIASRAILLHNLHNMGDEELAKLTDDDSWRKMFDCPPSPRSADIRTSRGVMSVAERTTAAREYDRKRLIASKKSRDAGSTITSPSAIKCMDTSSRLLSPTVATSHSHKAKYEGPSPLDVNIPPVLHIKAVTLINPSMNFLKPTNAANHQKWSGKKVEHEVSKEEHMKILYGKREKTVVSPRAPNRRTQADTTVVTPQKAMDPIPAPTSIAKTAAVMQIVMKARGRSSRTSILCPDIRASFASIEDNDMPICLLNSEEDNNMGFEDGNGEDVDLLSDSPIISSVWTADSPSPVDSTAVKVLHVEMSSPYSAKHDDGYHKKECSPVSTSMVSPFNTPPCSPFARILKETDALSALRGQVLEPKMINAAEDLLCGSITDAIASSGTGGDHQYLNIQ